MSAPTFPIIDSHIHLYPADELDTLAWCTPDNALANQRSVSEYKEAVGSSSPALRGFVFVETDRKNDSGNDWTQPLAEIEWLKRIVEGKPKSGQGHSPEDSKLVLGIVPWAPVHLGPKKLHEFLEKAAEVAGEETWKRVKGVRYLLQDKEQGTMLKEDFVQSLKLLGKLGLAFDLGIDQHRRGRWMLEEAVELVDRCHTGVDDDEKVVFILNHLCKPDLTIINPNDPAFIAWRTAMFTLSKADNVYMKLSGLFWEMPESLTAQNPSEIFMGSFAWLAVILAAFGASRTMFGSDWPVCTARVDGAWEKWRLVVDKMCYMATMSEDDQKLLWGGTAAKAYGLDVEE